MVKGLTLYYHPMCLGCMEIKPIVKEIAGIKGWKYTEVNIEHCKTKTCDEIEYVPAIFIDGKELDMDQIDELLSE